MTARQDALSGGDLPAHGIEGGDLFRRWRAVGRRHQQDGQRRDGKPGNHLV